jgi:hypothetical protein
MSSADRGGFLRLANMGQLCHGDASGNSRSSSTKGESRLPGFPMTSPVVHSSRLTPP